MGTVLVTGGCGFIGSAVVREAVRRGHEVAVLDRLTYAADPARLEACRAAVPLLVVDLADAAAVDDALRQLRPDLIVHCAAETHVDRSIADAAPFVRTNVLGTQVLLDTARRLDVTKVVLVSTDEVYGELTDIEGRFDEDWPLLPRSPYAVSKAAADLMGRAYWLTYRLPVVTVRPCNTFGPWQFPEKLVPVAILRALAGRPVPIYGDGLQRREWLHVEDCAAGILAAATLGVAGRAYNLGSGEERTNLDVVRTILDRLDRPAHLVEHVRDRPGHDVRYRLATERAAKELGWRARVGFDEGLVDTVAWYVRERGWADARLVIWDEIAAGATGTQASPR